MKTKLFTTMILVAIIFCSFVFGKTADCGEVAAMLTAEFYVEGENCKLYPIDGYYQNIIRPLRDDLEKIESDNKKLKVLVSSSLLMKRINLENENSRKKTPTTLKEMKKKGWKIVSIEVLTGSVYAFDRALKAYAHDDEHAHIFIFEK